MIGGLLLLSRYAHPLTMAFGTPILLLGGMIIPASALPGWISWVSYLVNLSWLQRFMASLSGSPSWGSLLIGCGVTLVYVVIAVLIFGRLLTRAKREATLELM
jgi:ABC-2 type transport system permease protein